MPKYASSPKMGKCEKPRKIKEKPTYKEKCEHDKNTIHLPRQELPFLLNSLILCGVPHTKAIFYNVFTTFEKRFDMTCYLMFYE